MHTRVFWTGVQPTGAWNWPQG